MSELQVNKRKGITFGRVVSNVGAMPPMEAPFPTMRTLRWLPQGAQDTPSVETEPAAETVSFVVTQEVLLATNRHVSQMLDRELGGFLLGNRYRCPNTGRNYVIIDQFLKADYTEGTEVSLNFTNESWAQLNDQLTGKFMGKLLVGWYHSHPRMSVFLSAHDVKLHEGRFEDPWKTALVIEPVKHMGGFFSWQDGKLDPHNYVEFYELLDGNSKESVVAWINYVGVDPKTNARPVVKGLNTKTVATAPATTIIADGRVVSATAHAGEKPAPAPPVKGLPVWLSGKRLWVGLGALTIVFFIAAFAIATLWSGSSTKNQQATNKQANPEVGTRPNVAPNALDALKVDFPKNSRPQANSETGNLTIELAVSDVPKDIVDDVQKNVRVLIDGREAELRSLPRGTAGGFLLVASADLREKINLLKSNNRPQDVEVQSFFTYSGNKLTNRKIIELQPFKSDKPVNNLKFKEKEDTTLTSSNRKDAVKKGTGRSEDEGNRTEVISGEVQTTGGTTNVVITTSPLDPIRADGNPPEMKSTNPDNPTTSDAPATKKGKKNKGTDAVNSNANNNTNNRSSGNNNNRDRDANNNGGSRRTRTTRP